MIHLARYLLILIGIALIPAWKLWILGGRFADRLAQRRHTDEGLSMYEEGLIYGLVPSIFGIVVLFIVLVLPAYGAISKLFGG